MDPKSNNGQPLDPKLQEVYDRVMGVNAAGDQTTPAQPTPPVSPTPAAPADQMPQMPPPMEPTNPAPAMPTPAMPTDPTPPVDNPTPAAPAIPEPPMPPAPVESPLPDPAIPPVMPANSGDSETSSALPTEPSAVPPVAPPTNDSMSATMTAPQIVHRDTETIKIGGGGNPVAAAAKIHKGISPVILIFGAFAFLVVYAVFWVRFFGYNLPFLSQ